MYEFQSEKFSGPLEKLLELIEEQKLGVNEISLAKVTDGFLAYLNDIRKNGNADEGNAFRGDLRILADFIAIASRLILLKSKYLLPGFALSSDEASDIRDLEERLSRYRELRPAIRILARLWRERHTSYSRPYFLGRGGGMPASRHIFYPGSNLDAAALAAGMRRIFDTITTYEMETETIGETIISLEEKIREVVERVTREGDTYLTALSRGGGSRAETVIVFLALLHLAREQLIRLEQTEHFSDIMVKKNGKVPVANDQ
jgi:segregation and condensation protein A